MLTRYGLGSSAVVGAMMSVRHITEGRICVCLHGRRRHRHPERRHEAGAGNPTDVPRWKGRRKMGDGVTSSVNAPANQTANAGNSGAPSPADTTAQSKFGEALKQESLCPGLGRAPHVAGMPPRYDTPCTYLRNPSQPSQPVDLQYHGDPDRLKGPTSRSNGPDYSQPIPQLPSTSLQVPKGPFHSSGLGSGDGAHIGGWEWKR